VDGAPTASYVHEGELDLPESTDPAAVGATVTTALCGHWEHEGPCRWPHNNAIRRRGSTFVFRTLFVAPTSDEAHVRGRIDRALRSGEGWRLLESRARQVALTEEELALRLSRTPTA
jgi:hypothetical protein